MSADNKDLKHLLDIECEARDLASNAGTARDAAELANLHRSTAKAGRSQGTGLVDNLAYLIGRGSLNYKERRLSSELRAVLAPIAEQLFIVAALRLSADAALQQLRADAARDVVSSSIVSVMP